MPTQNIRIKPGDCSLPPIEVDRQVVKAYPGTGFKFFNQLDGGSAAPDAILKFYNIGDKGQAGAEIEDYCGEDTGVELVVGPGQPEICNPTLAGTYAYTVEATNYKTLDPVLIIEPSSNLQWLIGMQPDQPPPGSSLLLPGIAIVTGLLFGYMFGKRR